MPVLLKNHPFRKRTCAPADDTTQLIVDGPFIPKGLDGERGAQVRFLNGMDFFTEWIFHSFSRSFYWNGIAGLL